MAAKKFNTGTAAGFRPVERRGPSIVREREAKSISGFKKAISQNIEAVRYAALEAVEVEANNILQHIKDYRVPVETGDLAASGYVASAGARINRLSNINTSFELGFSGPYAFYVHEGYPRRADGLPPRHGAERTPHPGKPTETYKFMDFGIRDRLPGMERRIANEIRSRLNAS